MEGICSDGRVKPGHDSRGRWVVLFETWWQAYPGRSTTQAMAPRFFSTTEPLAVRSPRRVFEAYMNPKSFAEKLTFFAAWAAGSKAKILKSWNRRSMKRRH